MKRYTFIIFAITAISLFIGYLFVAARSENLQHCDDEYIISLLGEELFANLRRANFYSDAINNPINRRNLTVAYPDFWGGEYINEDGNLVVNIVGTTIILAEVSKWLDDLLGDDHGVILQHSNFTYRELQHAQHLIFGRLVNNPTNCSTIDMIRQNTSYTSINTALNVVDVRLIDFSENQVALFREYVLDSAMLSFGQGYELTEILDYY